MDKNFEIVPVVTIEPVLGAEPHETSIILDDLGDPGLRQPISRGDASKAKAFSISYLHASYWGVLSRFRRRAHKEADCRTQPKKPLYRENGKGKCPSVWAAPMLHLQRYHGPLPLN